MLAEKGVDELAVARLILRIQCVGVASAAPQLCGADRWHAGGLRSDGYCAWPVPGAVGFCQPTPGE
jgi:hypothetical protein